MKLWILVVICFTRTFYAPPFAFFLGGGAFGLYKIWQMYFNIRGRTCVFSYSWPVCCQSEGLTNWFSDHLGACVQLVMVCPAQKSWNQIWSSEYWLKVLAVPLNYLLMLHVHCFFLNPLLLIALPYCDLVEYPAPIQQTIPHSSIKKHVIQKYVF